MQLNAETFSVKKAVEEVCSIIRSLAARKFVALNVETPSDAAVAVLDVVKFKQVLYNLLSNAVKFTPENGAIKLSARIENERIRAQVTDTGMGIKKEDLARLFREFQQLDSGFGRQQQGTGLGLALTKKIIELQGGSITVKSEFGKGSTFTVDLPAVSANQGDKLQMAPRS